MKAEQPRVMISPLNWGLGHATRCIPVIRALLARNAYVLLAGNGDSLQVLRGEFPSLQYELLPGTEVRYGKSGMSMMKMMLQLPSFFRIELNEHQHAENLIRKHQIDIVIADNRYGLWSHQCHTVLLSHQLYIKLSAPYSWLQPMLHYLVRKKALKFSQLWIPDDEQSSLSGDLSATHQNFHMVTFTGILSRFNRLVDTTSKEHFEVMAVLSGPEPQRSVLEAKLMQALQSAGRHTLLVRGVIGPQEIRQSGNITLVNHLATAEMQAHLLSSQYIICRSGYSSLMDLAALRRAAIIIPTPGQTEQEYLGSIHHLKRHYCMKQEEIDLEKGFAALATIEPTAALSRIDVAVSELLTKVSDSKGIS